MAPRKRESPLREAFVGMLVTVGPFFGVRYQPPHVEIPVVATPAGDDLDPATAPPPLGHDGGPAPADAGPPADDGARL